MRRGARGVTLLEVLVAILVLGIVLTAALRTAGTTARTIEGARERSFAHWAALNRAEELRMQGEAAAPGPTEERLGGGVYRVTETRSPGPFDLTRIELRAIGPDGTGAVLTTWLAPASAP